MKTPIYFRKDPQGPGAFLHDAFDKHLGYAHTVAIAEAIVAAVNVQMAPVAERKLATLVEQGWEVSGKAISKKNDDGSWRHGFVTDGGFVGWHHSPVIAQ